MLTLLTKKYPSLAPLLLTVPTPEVVSPKPFYGFKPEDPGSIVSNKDLDESFFIFYMIFIDISFFYIILLLVIT